MFRSGDDAIAERREWLGLLARAPQAVLEAWAFAAAERLPAYVWLRRPECGLYMVRGRIGGAGMRFNLGEMTVTRCALRLVSGASGVGYVQGRAPRRAELAALADACLQSAPHAEPVQRELIGPLRARLRAEAARQQRKAQATRVEFFAVAREAGAQPGQAPA
jgi:alpha-D-ribose 1-methylphosphonate 5-triphosphate synthase subunit PhnG